ncbi:DUF4426 domain-containing protein [Idiomarina seosinensis]|uniref:DUF4426 domain-containing protein n=1 Tax=Idiomarina seosinensis TaxID=281739 RepID=UPI00384FA728
MFGTLKLNLFAAVCALAMALVSHPASAQQKQTMNGWDVHYSAFNSTFLTPDIAAQYDITRSAKRGVINISVLDSETNEALAVPPRGFVSNPRGGVQNLEFEKITEGDAIYYLASFLFGDQELMRFTINLKDDSGNQETLEFEQELYHE